MGEFVSVGKILLLIFCVIVPLVMLVRNYLRTKFFTVFEIEYIVVSTIIIGINYPFFPIFYILAFVIYMVWWSFQTQKYKDMNPGKYEDYLKFYSEYYGDDLNNDGIKDAFENWQIAHDPRFFWLFGSRMAKAKRKMEYEQVNFEYRTGYSSAYNSKTKNANNTRQRYDEHGRRIEEDSYFSSEQYRNQYSGGHADSYAGNRNDTYTGSSKRHNDFDNMSEEEKKVARQHAFAKEHNLRYFAMCDSKAEAKKLYRKYAAKFHPDNPTTGNKEKFIMIDEEYNRFNSLKDIS